MFKLILQQDLYTRLEKFRLQCIRWEQNDLDFNHQLFDLNLILT